MFPGFQSPRYVGEFGLTEPPTLGEVFLVLRGLEFRRNHLFSSYSNQVGRALAQTLTRFHAHWAPLLVFPCLYFHEVDGQDPIGSIESCPVETSRLRD